MPDPKPSIVSAFLALVTVTAVWWIATGEDDNDPPSSCPSHVACPTFPPPSERGR